MESVDGSDENRSPSAAALPDHGQTGSLTGDPLLLTGEGSSGLWIEIDLSLGGSSRGEGWLQSLSSLHSATPPCWLWRIQVVQMKKGSPSPPVQHFFSIKSNQTASLGGFLILSLLTG